MKRALTCLLVAVLVACASNSGVFRVGENTYHVSTRATWELGGRVGAMRMAMNFRVAKERTEVGNGCPRRFIDCCTKSIPGGMFRVDFHS